MEQTRSRTCHFCPGRGRYREDGMGQNPEDMWVCPRQKTGIRPMEHGKRHLWAPLRPHIGNHMLPDFVGVLIATSLRLVCT